MAVTVLKSTDTMVIGRETDEIRALALVAIITSITELYGAEPLFNFTERVRAFIEKAQYVLVFERLNPSDTDLIPVGFMSWMKFSRPAEAIFKGRLRPLQVDDINSGSRLWIGDIVAPFNELGTDELPTGYGAELLTYLEETFNTTQYIKYAKYRGSPPNLEWRIYTRTNSQYTP